MSNNAEGSPEFDRPRRKVSEYDPEGVGDGSASEQLREIYALDPDDPGPTEAITKLVRPRRRRPAGW